VNDPLRPPRDRLERTSGLTTTLLLDRVNLFDPIWADVTDLRPLVIVDDTTPDDETTWS